jgi:hypothetical protein
VGHAANHGDGFGFWQQSALSPRIQRLAVRSAGPDLLRVAVLTRPKAEVFFQSKAGDERHAG